MSITIWGYQDLQRMFKRSYPTIYLWVTKKGLPIHKLSATRAYFLPDEVRTWARENNHTLYDDSLPMPLRRRDVSVDTARVPQ